MPDKHFQHGASSHLALATTIEAEARSDGTNKETLPDSDGRWGPALAAHLTADVRYR